MRIAQKGVIFQTSARITIHIAVVSWDSQGTYSCRAPIWVSSALSEP